MSTNRETQFEYYPENAPEFTEHVVWSRVVAVALTGVVLLVLLVWGSIKLFGSDQSEPFDPASLPPTAALPKTVSERTAPVTPAAAPQPNKMPQISGVIERDSTSTVQPSAPAATKTATETSPEITTPETISMLSEPDGEPAPAQPTQKQQAIAASDNPSNTSSNAPSMAEFVVNTKVEDGDVSRAALSDQMDGLEPATVIENSEALTADFIKLYFFTDIKGRRGDMLTYTWTQDGKTVAKVKIPVTSNRWRSHSSKNFNKTMRGDWQVTVEDKAGNTLAKSKFTLPETDS